MIMSGSSVKKEVRILGLDSCDRHRIVGAIVRGGLYLDGVLSFPRKLNSLELAREIRLSRYYPELRFIMVHQTVRHGKQNFDAERIRKTTNLPLIEITRTKPRGRNKTYTRVVRCGIAIYIHSQLEPAMTDRLLNLSWTEGILPEPVRVAHLLAKSISS